MSMSHVSAIITLSTNVTMQQLRAIRDSVDRIEVTTFGDRERKWLDLYAAPQMRVVQPLHYAPRTWADLNLERLGYGLLASIGAFVLTVAWIALAT